MLEKHATQGVFYCVYNGGYVLASSDMLPAQERKTNLIPRAEKTKGKKKPSKHMYFDCRTSNLSILHIVL